jgi:hypothetical protein
MRTQLVQTETCASGNLCKRKLCKDRDGQVRLGHYQRLERRIWVGCLTRLCQSFCMAEAIISDFIPIETVDVADLCTDPPQSPLSRDAAGRGILSIAIAIQFGIRLGKSCKKPIPSYNLGKILRSLNHAASHLFG